jgi:hypothetical protein
MDCVYNVSMISLHLFIKFGKNSLILFFISTEGCNFQL